MAEWIIEITDGLPHLNNMKPLVRCKDCKWFKEFTYNGKHEGRGLCDNPQNSMSKCPQIDWFCADGERREDADRSDRC